MATEKQIAANQLNAQKCTGPKSTEGKAKSSQNALKTGLHAKSDVIATENRDNYETLIAEYHDRFQPTTPEERCLVDNLIQSEWLGRRYMAATAAIWEDDFRIMKEQDLGRTFIRRDQTFGRAQRIVTANQRNYAQTLKQLLAIEANRASAAPSLPDDAADNEPLTPQLVSFFTETPESDPHQPPRHPLDQPEDDDPPLAA
jgi:hypothetical protein